MRAKTPANSQLVGICSGSWYAAQAARNIGAQSAILVNLVVWNWRVIPTLLDAVVLPEDSAERQRG